MGPTTIGRDRFDYVASISDSWKRQMLHNLLKVRYSDAPVFLDVASVINAYTWEGDVSVGGQVARVDRGDTFGAAGASGRYSDRPTVTYTPLSGEKFARGLMSPFPVASVLYLIQSGYPVDTVLRTCVNTINGLDNTFGTSGNPRSGDPRFASLLTMLREAQAAGALAFRIKTLREGDEAVMYLRPQLGDGRSANPVLELLGLDANVQEYRVVFGMFPISKSEIAIVTRSMMQVMIDYASYIDVPDADIAEKRVHSPPRSVEQERLFPPLLSVRNGEEAPADAHVALRYRNRWFWIDDRDWQSKAALNTLMVLFSLTETGAGQGGAPVVTIPVR
jgi:hypothetical protein